MRAAPNIRSEKLNAVLERFEGITDPEARAMMLIGYAERFREISPATARRPFPEDHRVPYCESEAYVWLLPQDDGTVQLSFAVENPSGISAKALAAILTETLSGSAPDVIASISPDIVSEIFRENISMGKGMGLMGMVEAVRNQAVRFQQSSAGSPMKRS